MSEDRTPETQRENLTQPTEPQTVELDEKDLDRVNGGTWTWTDGGINKG